MVQIASSASTTLLASVDRESWTRKRVRHSRSHGPGRLRLSADCGPVESAGQQQGFVDLSSWRRQRDAAEDDNQDENTRKKKEPEKAGFGKRTLSLSLSTHCRLLVSSIVEVSGWEPDANVVTGRASWLSCQLSVVVPMDPLLGHLISMSREGEREGEGEREARNGQNHGLQCFWI